MNEGKQTLKNRKKVKNIRKVKLDGHGWVGNMKPYQDGLKTETV